MRHGRWRDGVSLLAAVALTPGLLGWCGVASAATDAAEDGVAIAESIYGDVDDYYLFGGNNPPIPEPGRRRFLRDIPEVAAALQKWPAFFRDTSLDLHIRSYYFNRELTNDVRNEAWALGGWFGYQSGWLLDTLRVGAVGYTAQPAYAPDDRDGTGLLGPGQEGITVLGQVYAQLRYRDYALLTGGRQLVNQGYVNPQDNRMIPNTFEGATLAGTLGPVDYYVGYLTAMKTRTSDEFVSVSKVAGVFAGSPTDENRGLIMTSLRFVPGRGPQALAPLTGLNVFLGNSYVPDVFNTLYFNPEYERVLTDDWRLRFGFQYLNQRSVGEELVGSFSTWNVGFLAEVAWRGLSLLAMATATGEDAGILTPFGASPGYVSMIDTDFNRANQKAWEVGLRYNWGTGTLLPWRIPGLVTTILYAEGRDVKARGVELPPRREADLFTIWRPPKAPGFQFRFLGSLVNDEAATQSLLYDLRVIFDIELPLF